MQLMLLLLETAAAVVGCSSLQMNNLRVSVWSLGERTHNAIRASYGHLKTAVGQVRSLSASADGQGQGPAAPAVDAGETEVKELLTERGISSQLLRLSVLVVAVKSLHYFFDPLAVTSLFFFPEGNWLLTLESGASSIIAAPFWIWTIAMSFTPPFVPIVCGLAMAVTTWYTMFLDSCIPGIYHPATPSAKRFTFPPTFHLGHIIALVNSLIILVLIYQGYANSVTV